MTKGHVLALIKSSAYSESWYGFYEKVDDVGLVKVAFLLAMTHVTQLCWSIKKA